MNECCGLRTFTVARVMSPRQDDHPHRSMQPAGLQLAGQEAAACEIDPRRDLHSRSRLLSSLRWRGAAGVASAARAAGGMPQQLMFASAVRAACEQAGRRCMTLYM